MTFPPKITAFIGRNLEVIMATIISFSTRAALEVKSPIKTFLFIIS